MRRLVPALAAVCATLLCVSSAAAAPSSPATRLRAEVSRIDRELELLGRVAAPPGLPRNGSVLQARLENRDGYEVSVLAFGQSVVLGVSRGDALSGVETSLYLAHGKVTPTSISASFGDRGGVSLRFRPAGRALRLPAGLGCQLPADGVIGRSGVFVGRLSFRGEAGYTSVAAHRVQGSSIDVGALTSCLGGLNARRRAELPAPGVSTHPSPGPKPTALAADAKLPLSRTVFAAEARGSRQPFFLALSEASEGSLGIVRYAFVPGPRATFAFDDALSLAGVTPPAPFSGTATFQRGAGAAKSWSGSLAVSFLGAPGVALTGPRFEAQLTRGW